MSERGKLMLWSGIIVGLILVIGGAEYYFIWHTRIFVLQKENKKLQKEVKKMKTKKKKIEGLKKQKQTLIEKEKKFRKILPSLAENTPPAFMEELHSVAKQVGVSISQYSPSGGEGVKRGGGAGFETITMSIQARGLVFRLFRYIWALEDQERMIRVKDFSLSVSEEEVAYDDLFTSVPAEIASGENQQKVTKYVGQMNLSITVYIYSPPESE